MTVYVALEKECGGGVQMEEQIFWDCKLHGDQRTTLMDFLFENSKKEYPKSVTELIRLEEKQICARRLLLHKQNS
jgi:translation initiation factor 1 (eIF-1/SUI1)